MSKVIQFLKRWTVQCVSILPNDKGIEIEFGGEGQRPGRFRTRRFGAGRRGARTAALARFLASAGYGDVEALYQHLVTVPSNTVGPFLWPALLEDMGGMTGASADGQAARPEEVLVPCVSVSF